MSHLSIDFPYFVHGNLPFLMGIDYSIMIFENLEQIEVQDKLEFSMEFPLMKQLVMLICRGCHRSRGPSPAQTSKAPAVAPLAPQGCYGMGMPQSSPAWAPATWRDALSHHHWVQPLVKCSDGSHGPVEIVDFHRNGDFP